MTARIFRVALIALAAVSACRGGPPPVGASPPEESGVRARPLTVDEAAEILGARAPELSRCYTYERLNLNLPHGADYVAQVFVPNDGSEPIVEMVAAAVSGIPTLEDCLLRTLRRTRFPAHAGEPFTVNVPVEAPR